MPRARVRDRPRLTEVYPDWLTDGGIFGDFPVNSVPWDDTDAITIGMGYYGSYSGDKLISPLVDKIKTGDELTTQERAKLATLAVTLYGPYWEKQWATLEAEYNPIENYSMTETMDEDKSDTFGHVVDHTGTDRTIGDDTTEITKNLTDRRTANLTNAKTGTEETEHDTTDQRTANLTHAKDGKETRTDDLTHAKTGTETETPDITLTEDRGLYGFNSSVAVNSDTKTQNSSGNTEREYDTSDTDSGTVETEYDVDETETGTDTMRHTGTDTVEYDTEETETGTDTIAHTGTDTTETDTDHTRTLNLKDTESGTNRGTRDYTLTRAGNIGVTTSQQMLESERKLWMWNFFRDVVFPDLDELLTIPIY